MNYSYLSTEIRKKILRMFYLSQTAHLASCLSLVEILTVLYFKILKINPKKPTEKNRDRLILSKGHAVGALYAVLAQRGFFSENYLDFYCQNGEKLPGHSTYQTLPGVEASTGSLGHGLPIGAGMALSAKDDRKKYRVFVILSDGECDEGSIWESALFSSHHKLDNLVAIIDYNKLQAFGRTNEVLKIEPLKEKWMAFGWEVKEIDGHNFYQIEKSLSKIPFIKNKPSLVIAHTLKGKGISFIEDKLEWHYHNLTEKDYLRALKELKEL